MQAQPMVHMLCVFLTWISAVCLHHSSTYHYNFQDQNSTSSLIDSNSKKLLTICLNCAVKFCIYNPTLNALHLVNDLSLSHTKHRPGWYSNGRGRYLWVWARHNVWTLFTMVSTWGLLSILKKSQWKNS